VDPDSKTGAGAGRVVEESAPEDIGGQPVITGVCIDSAVPGARPARGWQALAHDWQATVTATVRSAARLES
jgi:hypothetical protein